MYVKKSYHPDLTLKYFMGTQDVVSSQLDHKCWKFDQFSLDLQEDMISRANNGHWFLVCKTDDDHVWWFDSRYNDSFDDVGPMYNVCIRVFLLLFQLICTCVLFRSWEFSGGTN